MDQAKRGIYIDFEGVKKESVHGRSICPAPPSLLGILVEEEFIQINFDVKLKLAADYEGLETSSLEQLIPRLVIRAFEEDRFLIAYTEHDLNLIKEHSRYGELVEDFYLNGRIYACEWNEELGRLEENINNSLKDFAVYLGKEYRGDESPAKWIRYVRKRLKNKSDFSQISPKGQDMWNFLLDYNRKDCYVLQELMILVAKEMSS